MIDYGDIDGLFEFFAVVTPDGRIPTVDDESRLTDPSVWYTGPIGTLAHLSDYASSSPTGTTPTPNTGGTGDSCPRGRGSGPSVSGSRRSSTPTRGWKTGRSDRDPGVAARGGDPPDFPIHP